MQKIKIRNTKNIALIAHDNKKNDLIEWTAKNREKLVMHNLYATGTTGGLIEKELNMEINRMQSGPLGGDIQIGALIATGKIDFLVFLWDPLEAQPHDPDVRALLRLAALWNIPVAANLATADFIFSSHLFDSGYERILPDYNEYQTKRVERLLKMP